MQIDSFDSLTGDVDPEQDEEGSSKWNSEDGMTESIMSSREAEE